MAARALLGCHTTLAYSSTNTGACAYRHTLVLAIKAASALGLSPRSTPRPAVSACRFGCSPPYSCVRDQGQSGHPRSAYPAGAQLGPTGPLFLPATLTR